MRDTHFLCGSCGAIRPVEEWTFWNTDHDDPAGAVFTIPTPPGEEPTSCRCPACHWDHVDDDSGPGIYDGTRLECERERRNLVARHGPFTPA